MSSPKNLHVWKNYVMRSTLEVHKDAWWFLLKWMSRWHYGLTMGKSHPWDGH